jgi:hypothetical protein
VSKKLAGIRLFAIELEIRRKPTAESAKTRQELITSRLPRNPELPVARDMNFNFIAFHEPERVGHSGRTADSETIAPFGNLHDAPSIEYTSTKMYIKKSDRVQGNGLQGGRVCEALPIDARLGITHQCIHG